MIRKMIGFKINDDEDVASFMQRTNRIIKNLVTLHGVISWDNLYHRYQHRWAGKLVQISQTDPRRLTSAIFAYKDWAWIQTVARENSGRQLHGRCLKIWRWERPLYKAFGDDWKSIAREEDHWRTLENWFIHWRKFNR